MGFPGGPDGKESACNAGEQDLIPGSGRSPPEGNGYPLQYYFFLTGMRWIYFLLLLFVCFNLFTLIGG